MSRRGQIEMSAEEVAAFLDEERVVTCATHGPRGWPHLMPLWFLVRGHRPPAGIDASAARSLTPAGGGLSEIWAWTYGKSQKVRNLERDPRATLQVEAGEEYHLLRGVMLECEVVIHRDTEMVQEFGEQLFVRYAGNPATEMVAAQAPKRVALQFVERRRATWDHRKLDGVY